MEKNTRKEKKPHRLYQRGKLKLISIKYIIFSEIYSTLENKLEKFVNSNKFNRPKRCFSSCKTELDNGF